MVTNKQAGYDAESVAREFLLNLGYDIIDSNWQNRWAEIDIIAKKSKRLYFVEVKSRKNTQHGNGLDYITPKKLTQMSFASQMWVDDNEWNGEYQLAAISIDGDDITYVEDI